MANYKKIYKKYFNIEFDSKIFHVHHIDFNRENNSIYNLILLPKDLHSKYHSFKNSTDTRKEFSQYEICNPAFMEYISYEILEMAKIYNEVGKWNVYREMLLSLVYSSQYTNIINITNMYQKQINAYTQYMDNL